MNTSLERSLALWNRSSLDLASDETLAQILDRGSMDDWRALYALARDDGSLRRRIAGVIERVPLPMPHLWIAALSSLGESISFDQRLPRYDLSGT